MRRACLAPLIPIALCGCPSGAPPEPDPGKNPPVSTGFVAPAQTAPAQTAPAEPRRLQPPPRPAQTARPTASVEPSPDDPVHGKWTLDDALKGLDKKGTVRATIETSIGTLDCKLYDDKAPLTVANFVGLARGTRPFKEPSGKWVKRAGYDGTTFHRIIRGFMIQGGDPAGTGAGEPGYVIPDEVWEGAAHDRAGLLCMANRGPNTNGMQFFVTDAAAPHLDGGYTIFGECGPEEVVHKIASADVRGDRAVDPPKIRSVKIRRGAK